MSSITKFNHQDDNHNKKSLARKPLNNKIPRLFQDDLALNPFNPFSQQLTPWNGSSKFQASLILLKKQALSKLPIKYSSLQQPEISVQKIVDLDSKQYANLAFHFSNDRLPQCINYYACPKLKVNSQQVIVSKNSKDEVRRFLFNKKTSNDNKNVKKISSLNIQWDEDIVYNPEKKYFDEQSLKRKILKEFSQTKNENRNQNSKKQLRSEEKFFKLEFKNNKIHRKQFSIFEFKKKDFSIELQRSKSKKTKDQENTPLLQTLVQNGQNNQIKVSNLSFEPNDSIKNSSVKEGQDNIERGKPYRSDKWKFRTSLKAKRTISPEKTSVRKQQNPQKKQRRKMLNGQAAPYQDKQALNRMTIELRQNIREQHFTPLQVFARTSPLFFKKPMN